jgi:hypothetical protein
MPHDPPKKCHPRAEGRIFRLQTPGHNSLAQIAARAWPDCSVARVEVMMSAKLGDPRKSMKIANNRPLSRPLSLIPIFGAGLLLAACAAGTSGSYPSGHATAQDLLALNHIQDASGINKRDLTPEEKAVVSHAVGLSISNPNTAQFKWPQIANTEDGNINYCGMVNAKSPYPAYNGWQAYIVEGAITGGKLSTAVVGLIAGGKDTEIVRKMCQKYGLDPGPGG